MFLSFCFHHGRVSESFTVGIFQSSAALASLRRTQYSLQLHCRKYGGQISHAYQIVGGAGEGKKIQWTLHTSRWRQSFKIATINSNHRHKVYPNLLAELTLTGTNQAWVADITYIRMLQGFAIWPPYWIVTHAR